MKLENIIKLRFETLNKAIENKKVDLADYPWDQCVADQTERYGDEETAKKVCGAIKAMYASKEEMGIKKEGFPIPSPEGSEDESTFIARCNKEMYDEYPDDAQRNAICYAKWENK